MLPETFTISVTLATDIQRYSIVRQMRLPGSFLGYHTWRRLLKTTRSGKKKMSIGRYQTRPRRMGSDVAADATPIFAMLKAKKEAVCPNGLKWPGVGHRREKFSYSVDLAAYCVQREFRKHRTRPHSALAIASIIASATSGVPCQGEKQDISYQLARRPLGGAGSELGSCHLRRSRTAEEGTTRTSVMKCEGTTRFRGVEKG